MFKWVKQRRLNKLKKNLAIEKAGYAAWISACRKTGYVYIDTEREHAEAVADLNWEINKLEGK